MTTPEEGQAVDLSKPMKRSLPGTAVQVTFIFDDASREDFERAIDKICMESDYFFGDALQLQDREIHEPFAVNVHYEWNPSSSALIWGEDDGALDDLDVFIRLNGDCVGWSPKGDPASSSSTGNQSED